MGCTRLCEEIGMLHASYRDGVKFCSKCQIYLFSEKVLCPCCNTRLRYKSQRKL